MHAEDEPGRNAGAGHAASSGTGDAASAGGAVGDGAGSLQPIAIATAIVTRRAATRSSYAFR